MNQQTRMQAAAQAGIEDFNGIFQERLRGMVREGLLAMFEAEVRALCGESYRPSESPYRRAGSELVTVRTSQGKERVAKRRVRETLPDGTEREVRLKCYEEVRRRRGMFDEILEAICHGASGSGVGKMQGVSQSTVCEAWKVRSRELLNEFRGRDLSGIDAVALMVDGVFPGKLSWKHRGEVVKRMNRLRAVQGAEAGEEAFGELLDFVREKNLAAAECLEKRREGILAFHGLNVPSTLNVTFLSTNNIENVMRNTRGTIGRVCRWNPKTDQLSRWMGVALIRAQEGFRRIRGHKEIGALATALGRSGSAASSLRSSSAAPARPSAGEPSELAGGSGFSYQMSISQPADVLTI